MAEDEPLVEVAQVGPDPRLLVVLVAVVSLGVAWMFLWSGDDGREATIGGLDDLAERAAAGPVRLVELPHIVVTRTPTRDSPVYLARWGENTGSMLLSSREQLVVLDTVDPTDGARLTWCPSRGVFEHPDGDRLYAPDGLLLAGEGRRGMDRRGVTLTAAGQVRVDDGRWVSGLPNRSTDTAFEPRGVSCVG